MFKKVNMIDVSDFDQLVEDTYGKIYSFQQQDGCKSRGTYNFILPMEEPYNFDRDEVPEIVNHDDQGVSFDAWLKRDPKTPLLSGDRSITLWWGRNFYPCVDMILDDLHKKGLLEDGKYVIDIDW